MDFSALNDVKMGEIKAKEDSLSHHSELENIKEMGELKKQVDAYLKQNLGEILSQEKRIGSKEKKVKVSKKNDALEVKERKKAGSFKNSIVNGLKVAKNLLVKVYPLMKVAIRKVIFKV